MVRFSTSLCLLLLTSVASGFVSQTKPAFLPRQSTELQVAPTMVIYWTIKSAIDMVGYAAGQSDSFQGTGVWKGVEFKREPAKLEETVQKDKTSTLNRKDTTTSDKTAEK
jgi:hypothetical protein